MVRELSLLQFLYDVYVPSQLDLSVGSIEQYGIAIRVLQQWMGREVNVHEFCDEMLLGFLLAYKANHAPATTNSKRRILLTLWRAACECGYLDVGPGKIPRLKEPQRLPEAWFVEDVERILSECRRQPGMVGQIPRRLWWPAAVLACYDTGGRIGAIRETRSADVSIADRYLIVRAEHQKSNRDRLFHLSNQGVAAIAAIHCSHREKLFPCPYERHWMFVAFRRIVEAAGLTVEKRGMGLFHRLRRTHLSYCAASDLELARSQAGHSSVAMTTEHYIDPRIAQTRSAIDVLPRPGQSNSAECGAWNLD